MAAALFALILMIGLIWLALWWMNRGNPGFDERQIEVQRKAYQMGFFIEDFYMLGLFIYGTFFGEPPVDWTLLILIGIWLAMLPVVTCMIWKDAYLKPGQSHLGIGIAGIVAGVMNLYSTVTLFRKAPAGESDRLWPVFLMAIFWLWVGGVMILKHIVNKRVEKAE